MKSGECHRTSKNKRNWDSKAIEDVKREKEKHRDSEDLERLRDLLENAMLKDSHFPLEFIQNAEDEESDKIGFHLYDSGLMIYNNGKPFRIEKGRNDIKGFCSIGISQKYKKGIGFLGVGSKTIFTITKRPWVVSGQYNFAVQDMLYPSPCKDLPPFSSDIIDEIDEFPSRGAIFYSPLLPDSDGKCEASKISDILNGLDQSVLMFLDCIDTVEVEDLRDPETSVTFSRRDVEIYAKYGVDGIDAYTCKRIRLSTKRSDNQDGNEENASEWIMASLDVNVSEDAKRNLPKSPLYDKKRSSKRTRISIAIPFTLERSYPLYCYLPLKESDTGLPFMLQGDFIPTVERQHIQTDLTWNKELLQNLGFLLAKTIDTCYKHERIQVEFDLLIPWDKNYVAHLEPFMVSFKNEIINMKFKFGDSSKPLPLNNYIICSPETAFLTDRNLKLIRPGSYSRLSLDRNSNFRKSLQWIGVESLSIKDVFQILMKQSKNKHINPVWIFDCYYSFAIADDNAEIDDYTLGLMQTNEWLLTNKRAFSVPHEELYFRMAKAKSEIPYIEDFIEVQFLHPIFTTFSGSRKYLVERSRRDVVRKFLTDTFGIQILQDEGHLIRNLVVPLLESRRLSDEKRMQYFLALLFYHNKLQKKLMRDGGYGNDLDRGKERLQEICKNILLPVTAFNIKTRKQYPAGLKVIEQAYWRGRKNHPSICFKIFNSTPDVYFLSQSFYKKIKERISFDDTEVANALEHIGISPELKILEKKYTGDDVTPFDVSTYLVDWRLVDYEVPGFKELSLQVLKENPEIIHCILKDLSSKYRKVDYGRGFLEASFTSSRKSHGYVSSIGRLLKSIKIKDKEGNEHYLNDFVFGTKFSSLVPDYSLLIPFDTKGMGDLLTALNMRNEPTEKELMDAIERVKEKYSGQVKEMPHSELKRLCDIYDKLSNFDSVSPDIFFKSNYLESCWFKPDECYWSDPTTQFKKHYPVIGDLYRTLGKERFDLFEKFGVNEIPLIKHIFRRFAALRERINKSKESPTHEAIIELRSYYKYLVGKIIPQKLRTRKIFLTDSGNMVDGSSLYTCNNIELHRALSQKLSNKIINSNIVLGFPSVLERIFNIKNIESTIHIDSIPSGRENNDLTILFRWLLKMIAAYEYKREDDPHEDNITHLQELSENIRVVDVERIEIKLNIDSSPIDTSIDTLFINDSLYLVDIRDDERILSRVREHAVHAILKDYSNETMNFAKVLISSGLTLGSIQRSFFDQGFSEDDINHFFNEMEIIRGIRSDEEESKIEDAQDTSGIEEEPRDKLKKEMHGQERKEKAHTFFPILANPFECEVDEIELSKSVDGEGRELGFKGRQERKKKPSGRKHPVRTISNLDVEEIGIEFVKMACKEVFDTQTDDDIKDVHEKSKAYDIIVNLAGGKKYIEMKASLSEPEPRLSRRQFERARKEKQDYYLFLVGNIQSNQGGVYVRYIQNPALRNHVRLGGARLKEINWDSWGNIKFNKRKKRPEK